MNRSFFFYAYTSIPKESYKVVFNRSLIGNFNQLCTFTAIKYFPLVIVSLISNIYPLLVALFGYLLYKEVITRFDKIVLLVSFIGVNFIISGAFQKKDGSKDEEE